MDGKTLLDAARDMAVIRFFEERVEKLFYNAKIRGSVHLGIGQEAVAVGACGALRQGDVLAATYRGHAWALARGLDLNGAFAEMLGKDTGCNRGRGGSKHLGDPDLGILPSNAIVAAAVPIACGSAWAAKVDRTGAVALTVFGDGATNQAVMHEAMNLAALYRLPVIFLCENNLYSEMTPIREAVTVERLTERAAAYRMEAVTVDGMDLEAVHATVGHAVERARAGDGPTFVEAMTYRFCGHMPGDPEIYRDKAEVERWRQRDPLQTVRTRLAEEGIEAVEVDAAYEDAKTAVAAAEEFANASPLPDPAAIGLGLPEWVDSTRPVKTAATRKASA